MALELIGIEGIDIGPEAHIPGQEEITEAGGVTPPASSLSTGPEEDSPGFFGTAADMGKGVVGGVRDAAQETMDFGLDVLNLVDDHTFNVLPEEIPEEYRLPDIETNTTAGRITRGISQFAAGFVGAGKFLKAAKVLQGAGKGVALARGMAQGAITDTVAFDPHEDRLSNLIEEYPSLSNPVTQYLAADEDDSNAEGRFKNALEGVLAGGAVDVFMKTVKGVKALRAVKGSKAEVEVAEQAVKEVEEAVAKAKEPKTTVDTELRDADGEIVDGSTVELTEIAKIELHAEKVDGNRAPFDHEGYFKLLKENQGLSREEIIEQHGRDLFNLSKFEGTDGTLNALKEMSSLIHPQTLKGRTGRETFEQIDENAVSYLKDAFDTDGTTLIDSVTKLAGDMEQATTLMHTAKMYSQYLGSEIEKTTAKIAANLEPGVTMKDALSGDHPMSTEILRLVKLNEQLENLSLGFSGIRTASARVTAAGRMGVQNLTWNVIKHGNEATHREIIEKLNINPKKMERYLKAVQAADKGDVHALYRLSKMGWQGRFWDLHNEYWINSVLSGFRTQTVNMTSNALKSAITPASKILGGWRMGDKELMREGMATYMGFRKFALDSVKMAAKAFKMEANILDPVYTIMDSPTHAWSRETVYQMAEAKGVKPNEKLATAFDWLGKAIRLPSRMLLTGDELFKQLNYRADLYARLYRQGVALYGDDAARIAQHVEDNFDKWFTKHGAGKAEQSLAYARETTWTQELVRGSLGHTIQTVPAKHPWLRPVLPFVRTPVNIVNDMFMHTPGINRLMKQYKADIAAGGERAAMAKGKEALGSLFWGAAVVMASEGTITGGGPKDKNLRDRLYETGWQPYSIKVGDKYYSFSRFDPYGMFLGLAADFAMIAREAPENEANTLAVGMITALSNNLMSKTYLKGLADTLNVITNPEMHGEKFLQRQAATYVPFSSAAGQLRQETDSMMREVRSVADAFMNKIPGFSDDLPARRSWVTGDPIMYADGVGPDLFSPMAYREHKGDVVMDELARLDYGFEPPSRKLMNLVELSSAQYSRLNELHGKVRIGRYTLHQRLEKLFKSDRYDIERKRFLDGPDASPRLDAVKKVIRSYRKAATRALLSEDRELLMAVEQARRSKLLQKRGKAAELDNLRQIGQ